MDEDEIVALLAEFEQMLGEAGLSSLVTQGRISAVEGKIEELTAEELAAYQHEWSLRGVGRMPRARSDDVRIRPLTARERLAELLDSLEAAVAGSYAIELHLRENIDAALDVDVHAK